MGSSKRTRHDSEDDSRPHRSSKHRSSSRRVDLEELGLKALDEDDDYFLAATPFRAWLLEEKGRYVTEMNTSDSRHYFAKFCKAYNKGKLSRKFYDSSTAPTAMTSHAWSINRDERELAAAEEARADTRASSGVGMMVQGPSRPTAIADLQYQREAESDARAAEKDYGRQLEKRDRREAKEEERDSRATGRDRLQEKRAERRGANREFASRNDDAGLEVDEATLMGGEDSFAAKIAERDRNMGKRDDKRRHAQEERHAALTEKRAEYKSKEDATMKMLREMAASRFG